MLTAAEALATSRLVTPQDYSLHKHLEVRIWDAIANGGAYIIYSGDLSDNVITALEALGYDIKRFEHENKRFVRIGWEDSKC